MDAQTITYMILATGGGGILGAYGFLIVGPALTAYGRTWEKFAAVVLSLFVLAAFIGAGLAIGLLVVYFWDDITGVFGALPPG